ncbi:hypothetical protein WNX12_10900, partial [Limosilactobacillus fermentum]|uniref:hypothetical protein n=1 Tax=Limosilactobacillus fermentum TaxID=1613 RepID=UPI0030EAA2BD
MQEEGKGKQAQDQSGVAASLPPRLQSCSEADALARRAARDERDARMRGVDSIAALRAAVKEQARTLAPIDA